MLALPISCRQLLNARRMPSSKSQNTSVRPCSRRASVPQVSFWPVANSAILRSPSTIQQSTARKGRDDASPRPGRYKVRAFELFRSAARAWRGASAPTYSLGISKTNPLHRRVLLFGESDTDLSMPWIQDCHGDFRCRPGILDRNAHSRRPDQPAGSARSWAG